MDTVSLDQFEALFAVAPLGIVAVDQGGVILRANPALEQMFGYPPGRLLGEQVESLLPEPLRRGHVAHRRGFLEAPRTRPMGQGLDLLGRRQDGSVFAVEVSLTHLALDGIDATIAFVADVSERVRLARERDELLEHERMARRAAEAVERRQALFAEVCRLLASTLDHREGIARVAELVLPALGAACAVYLAAGPALELVALAHHPRLAGEALGRLRAAPQPRDGAGPLAGAVRDGRPALLGDLAAAQAGADDWLGVWREAGAQTLLIMPCALRGELFGALVLATAEGGYGAAEQALAEALAVQIAQAVTNGRLYRLARASAEQHEAALAQLNTFVQSAPIGLGFLDPELRYRMINGSLAALNGAPPEAHIGRSVREVMPALAGRLEPAIRAVLATGEPAIDLELGLGAPAARAEDRQYLVSYYPVRTSSGLALGVGVIVQDLTARRRAEASQRLSEQRFRAIFDGAPLGMAIATPEGQIAESNAALQQMLGHSAAELRRLRLEALVHPDDRAEGAQMRGEVVAGQRGQTTAVQRFVRRDGETIRVSLTLSFVEDSAGSRFLLALIENVTERLAAEEARARLAAIVDSTDDAIVGTTFDERVFAWNAAAERLYGFSAAEVIGHSRMLLVPEERQQELREILALVVRGEPVAHVETQRLHKDGRRLDVSLTFSPIVDAAGAPIGISTIARDIGERRRVEQLLRRQEALGHLLQLVAVAANQASSVHSALQTAVDAVCEVIGWPVGHAYLAEEGAGEPLVSTPIWHLQDPQAFAVFRAITESLQVREPSDLPGRVLISGRPEWIADLSDHPTQPRFSLISGLGVRSGFAFPALVGAEVAAVLEFFSADPQMPDPALLEVLANVGTQLGRAIERDRAERALRTSEQMYRTLARTMPNGSVLLFDHQLRFTIAEGSALATAGLSREQIEGRTLREVLPTEAAERLEPLYRAALAGSHSALEIESGALVYLSHFLPVQGDGGGILAGMVMSYDITELKRVERELREERGQLARRVAEATADLSLANAQLARAARLKDEFLANMSHELRTPLNAILARSEALQEGIYGPVTPKQAESLRGVEESGRHLLSLINDILDLSKIEAGRLELEIEPLDVGLLCHTSLRMVAQLALMKRIAISSTLDGSVDMLYADERRLKQILVNLLSNAVKFTPDGGRVGLEVAGDPEAQTVTFAVWDTGIGIDAPNLERLFQPFVQIDSSLSRQYTGTGLGLALVLRLAEAHGGRVAVDSTPGAGSRFSVTLPWTQEAPLGEAPAEEPPAATAAALRRALVIEDSTTTVSQITRYLQELGAEVESDANGGGTVARAIAARPDVILLDILLPDQSGWEVLRALKAEPATRAIPVIVVSVVDDPARAAELGAAAFLLKPLSRDRLVEALQPIVGAPLGAAPQQAAPAARGRVLIAEDNQLNIDVLQDYLQSKGYTVTVARNGAEAVAAAHEQPMDVILMDIQMPGVDGLEAIRQLRASGDTRGVPIIAVTSLAMPGDRERCLEAGADDYLAKPLHLRSLVKLIEAQLGRPRDEPPGAA